MGKAQKPGEDSCCDDMRAHSTLDCELHADPRDCPDVLVVRFSDGGHGLPVRDGGSSMIEIRFCPWCGARLPEPA